MGRCRIVVGRVQLRRHHRPAWPFGVAPHARGRRRIPHARLASMVEASTPSRLGGGPSQTPPCGLHGAGARGSVTARNGPPRSSSPRSESIPSRRAYGSPRPGGRSGRSAPARRAPRESVIGLGHGGDPRRSAAPEAGASMQGTEHALRAAPGLRKIGRDQLDGELRQGPADLGRVHLVHTVACLGRVPVLRVPIGVDRAEQPVFRRSPRRAPAESVLIVPTPRQRRSPNRPSMSQRAWLRSGPTTGPTIRLVARAVRVQHHPHHRTARPLPAVRPASGRHLHICRAPASSGEASCSAARSHARMTSFSWKCLAVKSG